MAESLCAACWWCHSHTRQQHRWDYNFDESSDCIFFVKTDRKFFEWQLFSLTVCHWTGAQSRI